ncbi:MAG: hypothetical protein ACYC4J_10945 [Gemmatimonadaceae bacterium]
MRLAPLAPTPLALALSLATACRRARVALRPAMGRGPMANLAASTVTVRAVWGDPVSSGMPA